jgi:hypothetical protein
MVNEMTRLEIKKLTVDVVRQARSLIRKYGWTRGRRGNPERGFCVMGAIWFVDDTTGCPGLTPVVFHDTFIDMKLANGSGPMFWNDNIKYFGKWRAQLVMYRVERQLRKEIAQAEAKG